MPQDKKLEYESNDEIKIEPNFLETVKYGKFIVHTLQGTAPQTSGNYGIIFIARHPIEIMRVSEVHTAAGTDAGAVTLDVKKASSGTAIASGTTLLASTFSLKSTANTPVVKEGINLSTNRLLKENDMMGLVLAGTPTSLTGVNVTIYYKETNSGYVR